jgi:LppP/LprE lipoprotein
MRAPSTAALAVAVASCLSLSACGSATKTVSVGGAPPSTQAQAPGTATTRTQAGSSSAQGNGATSTRSAPAPAFTEQERRSQGLPAASAVLRARGFTPTNARDYHPQQALQVMIGMHTGSGDGYGQQAFFFVNGRYIGTDASKPSATLRVVGQSDTEVTLSYPLYHSGDPLCCPGGGQANVRFQLNNGKLNALDPIPSLTRSKSGLSRY